MGHWVGLFLKFMGVCWGPQNRGGCPCTPHSALRQLNVEWVLDITVVGNGGHMTNCNVNSGLSFTYPLAANTVCEYMAGAVHRTRKQSTPPTGL